jgi:NADH dehydrogenase
MPAFAIPGDGRYEVQPVHVDDLARICVQAAAEPDDVRWDAAGPETLTFERLVRDVRRAVGSHAAIVNVPAIAMRAASAGLGLLLGDVVLTGDEVRALTAGLLVSHEPPRGRTAFGAWLEQQTRIGGGYANELRRHFDLVPSAV